MQDPCERCKRRETCTAKCFPRKDYERGIKKGRLLAQPTQLSQTKGEKGHN